MIRIIAFILFVLSASTSFAQKENFVLVETSTIGLVESLEDEYLLGLPVAAALDSDGNIYIADGSRNAILVYSKNGVFKNSIGSRGSGPGEFSDITEMFLNGGTLVVIDRLIQRVTEFNLNGKLLKTRDFDEAYQIWPSTVQKVGENKFVVIANIMGMDFESLTNLGLVHIYGSTFNKIQTTIAQSGLFYDLSDDFSLAQIISGGGLNVLGSSVGNITIVKDYYDGIFYRLQLSGGRWNTKKIINSSIKSKPYKLVDVTKTQIATGKLDGRVTKIMNGPKGLFAIDELRKSFLLIENPTQEEILHIYGERYSSNKWIYSCELFRPNLGDFQPCNLNIEYLNGTKGKYTYKMDLIGTAGNGDFVFTDLEQGSPIVRIMRMEKR